jgi:hypothetical protein
MKVPFLDFGNYFQKTQNGCCKKSLLKKGWKAKCIFNLAKMNRAEAKEKLIFLGHSDKNKSEIDKEEA